MRPRTATPAQPEQELGDPLALAEGMAQAIESAAGETESRREMSPAAFALLQEAGFYRLLLPRSVGGYELPPSRFVQVIERIARADGSTAWCLSQAGGCAMAAAHLAPEVAQEIFGPRRAVLAWGAGPKGKAVPTPGGYQVAGSWMFASGGRQANWLGAHVPLCTADGVPVQAPDGTARVRTLLFPAADARMTDVWHVMGLKGTGSDNYAVEGLFVPEARSFEYQGPAHESQPGILYCFPTTLLYASGFACVAFGIARGMLDALLDLAMRKVPHNQKDTLRDSPVVQAQIAQAEATLGSARMYLLRSLEDIERDLGGQPLPVLRAEQRMRVRLAATFGIHQAKAAADIAFRLAGSSAIFENGPFERRFRDIHAVTQQLQGRQSHFETVGQFLLGLVADPANH